MDALSYFRTKRENLNIESQKLVVMEAQHGGAITKNLIYDGLNNDPNNHYTAKHLLDNIAKDVVFLEGSYMRFPANWLESDYSEIFGKGPSTRHYLGFAKSIDFAKTKSNTVHDVLASMINKPGYWDHFHSNKNIENANYMWFKAYTSIIHGATGIWFWDLNSSWDIGEKANSWFYDSAKYERSNFSNLYKNHISHLAKELRFLVNENILSSDPNTIIATKKDYPDPNCIVPEASHYIPLFSENYGLRYTIRSNGDETYMIITNPLNIPVAATLNFSTSSNQHIQYSTGVDVLFDNNKNDVTSENYKVNRNSNIDLEKGEVSKKYHIVYTAGKQLEISFGPLDVKVLKFVGKPPKPDNGWELKWSNLGNGQLGGHRVSENDLFYSGDFDGDGSEELLCVSYNEDGTQDWITLLKFKNENWDWYWSNYGSSLKAEGIYQFRGNLLVGDFNGDGKDEILGNNPEQGTAALCRFENNSWKLIWSINQNDTHKIKPFQGKFYSGNFNGTERDELLGCDLDNKNAAIFHWNGSDFIKTDKVYNNSDPLVAYLNNLIVGDFDGDGNADILGLDNWATLFLFRKDKLHWSWSTSGADNFSGWSYPLKEFDRVFAGHFNSDNNDDLLLIQSQPNAAWAVMLGLDDNNSDWHWKWSANPQSSVPFLNNWSLAANAGENTKYHLIKAKRNDSEYLMAMRKFCNDFLVNMYKRKGSSYPTNSAHDFENNYGTFDSGFKITIFPNPSKGKMQITSTESNINSIEIFNIVGRSVLCEKLERRKSIDLDISNHPAGVYFIKVSHSTGESSIHKIISID